MRPLRVSTCCYCREEEPKYIVRTLISNLRVGANWRSVIPGLARAFVLHEKGPKATKGEMDAASAKVSEAFHLCPNLGVLIPALMEGGLEELERRCTLKAGGRIFSFADGLLTPFAFSMCLTLR